MNYKKSQDTFTKNTLFVQIIFVVVAVGGILLFEKFFSKEVSWLDNGSNKEAVLLIDFDDIKRMFKGEIIDKMTVLDALNASVATGNIKLRYIVDNKNNTSVTEINNHTANENKKFAFYINGKNINTADLNKIFVYPRDEIIIKLE